MQGGKDVKIPRDLVCSLQRESLRQRRGGTPWPPDRDGTESVPYRLAKIPEVFHKLSFESLWWQIKGEVRL